MRLLILISALFLGVPGAGADTLAALRGEGVVLMMRHALAPGTGDPSNFTLDDCSTQRNLDARGRTQARAVGAALRDAEIEIDRVWTSQWCRCRDTAVLLDLGTVEEKPFLNSFFGNRSLGPAQTEALRAALRDLPRGARPILVTHQVNITGLTGVVPRSGEIVAISLDDAGAVRVLDRVILAQ